MKIEPREMTTGEIYRIVLSPLAGENTVLVDFVEFIEFGSWKTGGAKQLEFAVVRSDQVSRPHIVETWRIRSVYAYDT